MSQATTDILRHLAGRPGHDEVKADFRQLLVEEFGVTLEALEFERRVPEVRGRLDALIGRTIFEAKSDLDREWRDVERRLPDYLADREREEGEQFVGLASDGLKWAVFELAAGRLALVKRTTLDPEKPGEFLAWLDGALALKSSLPPDPLTVRAELGRESMAFHRVDTHLRELWGEVRDIPAVALKRQLWADLLKQVYGRDVESDGLWFQHSFLVIVAKSIALAVMRMPEDDPKRLLSGEAFTDAGIHGAVESDFFDWVVAVPEGEALVRRIMAHVRRFRLAEVETDVLKVLYESLIDREERHGLGEYYTPDWLAAKVVRRAVSEPLQQRVLDPACGSGTFLFHAVRNLLAEAEEAGMPPDVRALHACGHVTGIDIHPVAAIIARVTFLLALGPVLGARGGPISIPVYLGDAMQLSTSEFMTGKELTIRVPPAPGAENGKGEGGARLDFPEAFCRHPGLFDKAIERMRTGSLEGLSREQMEKALHRIVEQHFLAKATREFAIAIQDLGKTYVTLDRLRQEERDTIWVYVARNLSRPLAYSASAWVNRMPGEPPRPEGLSGGWAQVVVGNPPWVAFRHMSPELQKRFKELAKGEKVYVGGKFATQNDLCALFAVRAVQLYLQSGGRLGLVLPMAVLTRGQFAPLRAGSFTSVRIAWDEAWSMDESVYPLFPVPSCVLFGRRRATAKPVPDKLRAYSGTLPMRDAPEAVADGRLKAVDGSPALETARMTGGSVYRKSFRQGAILVPRMLCLVERRLMGRLGVDPSAPLVSSRRNSQEKLPWKDMPGVENRVEAEFLRPIFLGESIVPFRVFRPFEGVVPADGAGKVLDAQSAADHGIEGLFGWMRKVEACWNEGGAGSMTFVEQLDYYGKLSSQFPIAPLRVVYAKAGTQPAACLIRDRRAVIDHKLYWTAPETEGEALYLMAFLNSEEARGRIAAYQSRGLFGARDFDKVMFNLPIPRFDSGTPVHRELAQAAAEAETIAAGVELAETEPFQRARAKVRAALVESGVAARIDRLVGRLLT